MKLLVLCLFFVGAIFAQNLIPGNIYSLLNRNRIQGINTAEGTAAQATISDRVVSVVKDVDGSILFVEFIGCRIRRIGLDGRVTTVAGIANNCALSPDGSVALSSKILIPTAMTIDPIDNAIVFAEANIAQIIRKIRKDTGTLLRIAGNVDRRCQNFGDGGNALNAGFCVPAHLSYDSSGNLFVADVLNHRIRRIDRITNIITTVVGNGQSGFNGDNLAPTATKLTSPNSFAFNALNQIFVANYLGHRIQKSANTVSTFAGTGAATFSGEGVPRTSSIVKPSKVALDGQENLFFYEQVRIRKIDNVTGLMTTVIGGGSNSGVADNVPATSVRLSTIDENLALYNFFVDTTGDIVFSDSKSIWRAIAVAAPQAVCGNGIVEPGEQCDSANLCCDADCKFHASTFVCRGVAGPCDVAEKCSGTSDDCPTDAFAPSSQVCGQAFGVCEVGIPTQCSGTAAACPSLPILNLPAFANSTAATMDWADFNLVSFNDITGDTGSVEGRIAAKRDVSFGSGFSVADKINTVFDPIRAYSLVSGRDTTWVSGALYPNSLLQDVDPFHEDGFVGGIANVATSLDSQLSGNGCAAPGCLNNDFDAFKSHLSTKVQPFLASLPSNVDAVAEFSGLFITCRNQADTLYVLNTDAATLASVTWYSLRGCDPLAGWIINVQNDASDVVFSGDHLPSAAERTVYNILGSGRNIRIQTQVNGNIVAPLNNLIQTGGFISGNSFVGNAAGVSSIVVPRCGVLRTVTVVDFTKVAASAGSNIIVLASGGNIVVGDVIVIGGQSRIVVGRQNNADGSTTITLDTPLSSPISANSRATVQVDLNNALNRDDGIRPAVIADSASGLSFSIVLIFAALYLLF